MNGLPYSYLTQLLKFSVTNFNWSTYSFHLQPQMGLAKLNDCHEYQIISQPYLIFFNIDISYDWKMFNKLSFDKDTVISMISDKIANNIYFYSNLSYSSKLIFWR